MKLYNYKLVTFNHEAYEFLSEGPKGRIRKIIRFHRVEGGLYNLGFGDWNEEDQLVNDRIRSNNGDMDKVLATVAAAVIDFMNHHPRAVVFARGTTPARTRLYQIGLWRHRAAIGERYSVKAIISGVLTSIEPGINYDAFVLAAKEKE